METESLDISAKWKGGIIGHRPLITCTPTRQKQTLA
jgi:hypothetical protein